MQPLLQPTVTATQSPVTESRAASQGTPGQDTAFQMSDSFPDPWSPPPQVSEIDYYKIVQFDNYLSLTGQKFVREYENILVISDDCCMEIRAVNVQLKPNEATEHQPE